MSDPATPLMSFLPSLVRNVLSSTVLNVNENTKDVLFFTDKEWFMA